MNPLSRTRTTDDFLSLTGRRSVYYARVGER